MESPQITATCVEATEFPDLVGRYGVTGVPKTVVLAEDGTILTEILGAVPEAPFVEQIVEAAREKPQGTA